MEIVGLIATLAGLYLTWRQAKVAQLTAAGAKEAAEAARDAVRAELTQREAVRHLAQAVEHLKIGRTFWQQREWSDASASCDRAHEQLAHIDASALGLEWRDRLELRRTQEAVAQLGADVGFRPADQEPEAVYERMTTAVGVLTRALGWLERA